MRNWNVFSPCDRRDVASYQPTYEELKHAIGEVASKIRDCYQPTYEELKR